MKIITAEFVGSFNKFNQFPKNNFPEIAFIGRSNVGKSSLINMLCQKKNLAKTSSTPGKTQQINFFNINSEWFLIDLPGYGYAKTSKSTKKEFQHNMSEYLKKRNNLLFAFLLIDIRLPAQKIDLEFMEWLHENVVPFALIFTKSDKISSITKIDTNIANYKEELSKKWDILPDYLITSSAKKEGRDKVMNYVEELLKLNKI